MNLPGKSAAGAVVKSGDVADDLAERGRAFCWACRRAQSTCLCAEVRPFQAAFVPIILLHPRESKKRVGTASIIRRCITNAQVIVGTGEQLERDAAFLKIVDDPDLQPCVLFPGKQSFNLSEGGAAAIEGRLDSQRKLVIFVVDGTWPQAQKMVHVNARLRALPRLSFTTAMLSQYRIRKQPAAHCLSSLEAIHVLMETLAVSPRFPLPPQAGHRNLLESFNRMVERQLVFENEGRKHAKYSRPAAD